MGGRRKGSKVWADGSGGRDTDRWLQRVGEKGRRYRERG